MNRPRVAAALGLLVILQASAQSLQAPRSSPIDALIARMTIDEKIGQLVQYTGRFADPRVTETLSKEQLALIRRGAVGSLLNVVGPAARQAQEAAVRQSRLRIPLLLGLDVIHGYRTTFPIPLATAATWDPALVERCEAVAAREASIAGIHWTFAPMVDIARDPRWGRIAEGSGEDPYLGSVMAAARIRGFQGNDLRRPGSVAACAKHFAAYGGAEGGRDYNTVDVSEKTLREIYLPPFQAAVDAGAASFMCSFNEIAGLPSSANRALLTGILRGEWGFTGMVVSDWNSIGELMNHRVAGDLAEAAALGITAGVDMDMEADAYQNHLAALVKEGRVPLAVVDEAVRRVLVMKERLGLFEDPFRGMDETRAASLLGSPEHRALARTAAQRSIVLLKNDELLPLRAGHRRIALIGPLANDRVNPLGPWNGLGDSSDVVTVHEGLRRALPEGTTMVLAAGCGISDSSRAGFSEAARAARSADIAIVVVGESLGMSGEAASRSSLGLPGVQQELVEAIAATGTPYVVVLMNGRPLAIPWIAEHAPAILETWFLGVECGNAVADVLTGVYNPSGRLPVTFPRSVGQVPLYYNHTSSGRPANDSVRWSARYIDLTRMPLYPFGYGLSYTTFRYDGITLSDSVLHDGDTMRVRVQVRNMGTRVGEEVVQLYLRDDVASVTRPVKELKRFARYAIEPGSTAEAEFRLTIDDLRFLNARLQSVAEPGSFRLYAGPNSAEGLEASFVYRRK